MYASARCCEQCDVQMSVVSGVSPRHSHHQIRPAAWSSTTVAASSAAVANHAEGVPIGGAPWMGPGEEWSVAGEGVMLAHDATELAAARGVPNDRTGQPIKKKKRPRGAGPPASLPERPRGVIFGARHRRPAQPEDPDRARPQLPRPRQPSCQRARALRSRSRTSAAFGCCASRALSARTSAGRRPSPRMRRPAPQTSSRTPC